MTDSTHHVSLLMDSSQLDIGSEDLLLVSAASIFLVKDFKLSWAAATSWDLEDNPSEENIFRTSPAFDASTFSRHDGTVLTDETLFTSDGFSKLSNRALFCLTMELRGVKLDPLVSVSHFSITFGLFWIDKFNKPKSETTFLWTLTFCNSFVSTFPYRFKFCTISETEIFLATFSLSKFSALDGMTGATTVSASIRWSTGVEKLMTSAFSNRRLDSFCLSLTFSSKDLHSSSSAWLGKEKSERLETSSWLTSLNPTLDSFPELQAEYVSLISRNSGGHSAWPSSSQLEYSSSSGRISVALLFSTSQLLSSELESRNIGVWSRRLTRGFLPTSRESTLWSLTAFLKLTARLTAGPSRKSFSTIAAGLSSSSEFSSISIVGWFLLSSKSRFLTLSRLWLRRSLFFVLCRRTQSVRANRGCLILSSWFLPSTIGDASLDARFSLLWN